MRPFTIQAKNGAAVDEGQFLRCGFFPPGAEFVEHPLAMLMNQAFDVAQAGPAGGAGGRRAGRGGVGAGRRPLRRRRRGVTKSGGARRG